MGRRLLFLSEPGILRLLRRKHGLLRYINVSAVRTLAWGSCRAVATSRHRKAKWAQPESFGAISEWLMAKKVLNHKYFSFVPSNHA